MKDKFVLFLILVAVVALLPGCDFIYYSRIEAIQAAQVWCENHNGLESMRVDDNYYGERQHVIARCGDGVKIEGWVKTKK